MGVEAEGAEGEVEDAIGVEVGKVEGKWLEGWRRWVDDGGAQDLDVHLQVPEFAVRRAQDL